MTDMKERSTEPVGHTHRDLPLDKVTFGVAAGLVLAFLVWGTADSTGISPMGDSTTRFDRTSRPESAA